jgi:signal transduction histidine kinase
MKFRLSHLALLITVAIVTVGIAGVIATYRIAEEELRDILNDDLRQQARMMSRLLDVAPGRVSSDELKALLKSSFQPDEEETLLVNLYDLESGDLTSNQDHSLPLMSRDNEDISLRWDGHDWEGYQRREGGIVVQLLRRSDLYEELQGDILEDITAPAAAGSLITLLLLALLIGFLLWPLSRLVRALESRKADSLAPLDVPTPVVEVRVLIDTVNRLIGDVDSVLQRERQFASDVAHELRTPLTTLKIELAGPEPDLPLVRTEVDRLARLVEQLLTLARLEQGRWRASFGPVALDEIWARESGQLVAAAGRAGMTLTAAVSPALIDGEATLLQVLLRNLVSNAVRHCPAGTHIQVTIGTEIGRTLLCVGDDGPGISEDQCNRMNIGFTRLDSRSEGLGLGLAICRRIAEVHGATLRFLANDDGAPGLRVEVAFGLKETLRLGSQTGAVPIHHTESSS